MVKDGKSAISDMQLSKQELPAMVKDGKLVLTKNIHSAKQESPAVLMHPKLSLTDIKSAQSSNKLARQVIPTPPYNLTVLTLTITDVKDVPFAGRSKNVFQSSTDLLSPTIISAFSTSLNVSSRPGPNIENSFFIQTFSLTHT